MNWRLNQVPKAMAECLDKSGLKIQDIKKILIHQANEKWMKPLFNVFIKLQRDSSAWYYAYEYSQIGEFECGNSSYIIRFTC